MLIGFSVRNYKSFKEEQRISLNASKIVRHKSHVMDIGSRRILKGGLIFGANAGGKSNLIRAINFSKKIVLGGLDSLDISKSHFRIDNSYYEKPGVFEYRIYANGQEYSYGIAISYSKQEIISEWLYRIEKSGNELCIFNRNVDESGKSTVESDISTSRSKDMQRLSIYLDDFGETISDVFRKKTILSDLASRGSATEGYFAEINSVFSWFERLIVIYPGSKYTMLNELGSDSSRKSFFQSIMNYFYTGIQSIESQEQEFDFDKLFENIPHAQVEKLKADLYRQTAHGPFNIRINDQFVKLNRDNNGNVVYNKLILNHGNPDDMFEYSDESDGTKRLFDLVPILYDLGKDSVILIDEIDRSLHTKLSQKFLEKFYENNIDNTCQLIATTHDSNLLDLDLIRQDEIWFVERDNFHSSQLYSLNKFRERFDKKIDKEYLLGRYGAIPIFNDLLLSEESATNE